MNTYKTDRIRNVVLLGSTKSGKTTLSEAMMFEGKVIDRRGTVEGKNTISDNTEVEQLNQRSIYSTALYTEFMNAKFNIMDSPGADDFIGGMISSFKVCDAGILVVNATQGVEVGTEIFGRYASQYKKPCIVAINQLDHENADWEGTVESIRQSFGKNVVLVQFPVATGEKFNSFVDVLKMKLYTFTDENGTRTESEIPEELMEKTNEVRLALMEMAAVHDEELMEKYFETGNLEFAEMIRGLHAGFLKGELLPAFCLSAKKDIGVKRLMEFAINVAPNPASNPTLLTDGSELPCDENGPTVLFIYHNALEQHLGDVSYFKVVSGKITEGMDLINPETGNKERITSLYAVAGKKREKVSEMVAGDIGCTVKLRSIKSNQTLCEIGKDIVVSRIEYPQAKYRTAIKAVEEKDEEKLGEILNRAVSEDPSYEVRYAKELKQTILSGQGEQHINILKWQINNVHKIEVELSAPKISYRETITKVAAANYRHKKQSGGAGQFGEVHLLLEPYYEGAPENNRFKVDGKEMVLNIKGKEEYTMDWGGKLEFYNCIVGGAIDARFMPAILKGIMEKMEEGPLTGSYARDIRVYVYDGKMHPVDSNEISFKLAARNAFKEAFRNAGPKIMEPMCNIEIMVPGDYMGDVMSDLQGRRAIIEGMSSVKGFEVLKAKVPLAELYKYSTTLSSLTSGRASFTMENAEYQQVPADVQEKLLKAYQEEESED